MNFLLRNSSESNLPAADAASSAAVDAERDQKPVLNSISFNSVHPLPLFDSAMGDDSKGTGEFGSIWTRMPIEDHYDFPPEEGAILVPFRESLAFFSPFLFSFVLGNRNVSRGLI
jgi:hypothetical protein